MTQKRNIRAQKSRFYRRGVANKGIVFHLNVL